MIGDVLEGQQRHGPKVMSPLREKYKDYYEGNYREVSVGKTNEGRFYFHTLLAVENDLYKIDHNPHYIPLLMNSVHHRALSLRGWGINVPWWLHIVVPTRCSLTCSN